MLISTFVQCQDYHEQSFDFIGFTTKKNINYAELKHPDFSITYSVNFLNISLFFTDDIYCWHKNVHCNNN